MFGTMAPPPSSAWNRRRIRGSRHGGSWDRRSLRHRRRRWRSDTGRRWRCRRPWSRARHARRLNDPKGSCRRRLSSDRRSRLRRRRRHGRLLWWNRAHGRRRRARSRATLRRDSRLRSADRRGRRRGRRGGPERCARHHCRLTRRWNHARNVCRSSRWRRLSGSRRGGRRLALRADENCREGRRSNQAADDCGNRVLHAPFSFMPRRTMHCRCRDRIQSGELITA
jgi:hypothetical protein